MLSATALLVNSTRCASRHVPSRRPRSEPDAYGARADRLRTVRRREQAHAWRLAVGHPAGDCCGRSTPRQQDLSGLLVATLICSLSCVDDSRHLCHRAVACGCRADWLRTGWSRGRFELDLLVQTMHDDPEVRLGLGQTDT